MLYFIYDSVLNLNRLQLKTIYMFWTCCRHLLVTRVRMFKGASTTNTDNSEPRGRASGEGSRVP